MTTGSLLAQTTILVVDDVDDSRVVLCKLMEASGYRVESAADGAEAIEVARRARPDLILLDLNLPVMDGLGVVERLRSLPELKNVQVIAMTAYHYYGMREAALEAGCNEYMAKPLDHDKLAKVIQELVRK
jgi:two-component system cell cycle response regulator DivK